MLLHISIKNSQTSVLNTEFSFCGISSYNPDKIDYFSIVEKEKFERIFQNEIKFVEYEKKNLYQQQKKNFCIKNFDRRTKKIFSGGRRRKKWTQS